VSRAKLLPVLKYVTYIVLLLNFGSLPFMWHIRVFWPITVARLDYWVLRLKLVFASRKEQTRSLIAWAENLSPVGANPFEIETVYRRWASLDDCDVFGMHLSNSSYAKAFDSARVKALVKFFPAMGRSGGQMALGATHYHFIREIAPLARYEVRLSIGAWDHKWLYVVARFVTRPGRRDASRLSSAQSSSPSTPPSESETSTPLSQNGSATTVERAVAAVMYAENMNQDDANGNANASANGHIDGSSTSRRVPIVEPDGAILHCVAVSQTCYKWGRITIPPAVVLASEGFTKPYDEGDDEGSSSIDNNKRSRPCYSHTNPPPNWIKSQALRVAPQGSMGQFQAFLRGGWRDVEESSEQWWEVALSGSVEARRRTNLEVLEALRVGMERVRGVRYCT